MNFQTTNKRIQLMEFAQLVLQFITSGGSAAMIALQFAAIIALIWDRKQITKALNDTIQRVYDAKDSEVKSISEIIEKYHQGNLNLVQALNEIKIVLVTIQNSRK